MTLRVVSVACGVCNSETYAPFASGKDYEYNTTADVFHMVRCLSCGNVYLNPRPVAEELGTIYPDNYYSYNYDKAINPIALKAKKSLDQIKARGWLKSVKQPKPVVLDVGCGNGHILELLQSIGIPKTNLFGVEMNEAQMKRLRDDGYQAFNGRIEDVAPLLSDTKFDLILLLQVLEHVEHPATMIDTLSKMLAPGGVLILETPNSQSLDVDLFSKSYWGGYHFPRHFNIFDKNTLHRLVKQNGLDVLSTKYLPAHSFWIFSLHHSISDGWHCDWLARWFDPLQNIPLLAIFTAFDLVRAGCGFKTSNIQVISTRLITDVPEKRIESAFKGKGGTN
jgi:2-polyprenyl-3-methyl-5-hydroxy-6-metoxy-1,4-benzoquinol methylase